MVKAHFQLKFQKDLHDNYTAGFATSETNVAMLTDETFSKYFSVHTDKSQKDYTKIQMVKYLTLYGLYSEKFEGKEKD